MVATWEPPAHTDALEALAAISDKVSEARHEGDVLERLAGALQKYVGCDAVILRQLERHIQTRAVATKDGVVVLPADELWAPFTSDDRDHYLSHQDGFFIPNIETQYLRRTSFRDHALRLGLKCSFMVPFISGGDVAGQVTFAWRSFITLTDEAKRFLHRLTNYAWQQFTLFNVRQAHELDAVTGLFNRMGLKRRWEAPGRGRRGAVFVIEVTGLRNVADARGLLAAEDILRQTARMLRGLEGRPMLLGRFGDGRFVIVASGLQDAELRAVHESIRTRFDDLARELPPPRPRCGIAVVQWPRDGEKLQELVAEAEQRLVERKRQHMRLTMTTESNVQLGRLPRLFADGWLTTSRDGIIITDADRKVIYVNEAYERMSGYSLQHWAGRTSGFIASGKTPPEVYEDMWDKLNEEGAWLGEVVNRRPDGEEWNSFVSITKIYDRSGHHVGFLGVARDVTDGLPSKETCEHDDDVSHCARRRRKNHHRVKG